MTIPREWTPGDPITAGRLNVGNAESLRSRRDINLGPGSSLVNETLGNQSANMQPPLMRLSVAIEDFEIQPERTDLNTVDDVPSALCKQMRLSRNDSTYREESISNTYRVWDATGGSKKLGEVFYAVFNRDSKRWEALVASGGTHRIRFIIDEVVCADPDYGIELHVLVFWTHYSGGCKEPPGQEYDGRIAVYDSCVLTSLTDAQLVGRIGSATFWHKAVTPGSAYGGCTTSWIVDDLCDALECE